MVQTTIESRAFDSAFSVLLISMASEAVNRALEENCEGGTTADPS